jgi:hypothetical protein
MAYLQALTGHRPVDLAQPTGPDACQSLRSLRSWLSRVPVEKLHVVAVPIGSAGPHAVAVLATVTGRLGHNPGTIAISLGQHVLAVGGGALPRVIADVSAQYGPASDGLAAIRSATYLVGSSGVVVSDEAPASDARMARSVLDAVYPRLSRRYRAMRLPAPIVAIVPDLQTAEEVIGTPVTRYDAGIELGGLVVLIERAWCCGTVQREGIVAHELTHAAARRLVTGPISMVEGIARYEEENWDTAHAAPLSQAGLAAAYRSGWSSTTPWESGLNLWYQVPSDELELRYLDAAAIVRQGFEQAGLAGFRRLATAFDKDSKVIYTRRDLDRIFRGAIGLSFSEVARRAHAATMTAAG